MSARSNQLSKRGWPWIQTRTGRFLLAGLGLAALFALGAPGAGAGAPVALLVGPAGTAGAQFASIHDAVAHAHEGDWVLVAPGDYHEKGTGEAGVLITTPGIHVRGMDRNRVVVDGTNPGATAPCAPDPAVQDLQPAGRNGIEVVKADGTSIENLTVCNFLASPGGHNGNQIWWNGGD